MAGGGFKLPSAFFYKKKDFNMANNFNSSVFVTSRVDGLTIQSSNTSVNVNTTSSNAIGGTAASTGSVWTQQSLTPLTDVLSIWLYNDNTVFTASIISVATGSSGGNVLTILQPGFSAVIPWSGSLSGLYHKVVSSAPNTVGTLQFIAQQS
jgi:hypothetical protein